MLSPGRLNIYDSGYGVKRIQSLIPIVYYLYLEVLFKTALTEINSPC
jgi:hypothetical protein